MPTRKDAMPTDDPAPDWNQLRDDAARFGYILTVTETDGTWRTIFERLDHGARFEFATADAATLCSTMQSVFSMVKLAVAGELRRLDDGHTLRGGR